MSGRANGGGIIARPSTRVIEHGYAILRTFLMLMGLYAFGGTIGFTLFALLFKAGLLNGMTVLFFRGLLLAGVAFVILFVILLALKRWHVSFTARDAFGTAMLSLSFNICFLVVVPVTVDRSISVFILGEMAMEPNRLYEPAAISALFTKVYVSDYQQIDRRLREQSLTGNLERINETYRITQRGLTFIALAKWSAWVFGGDTRFVSPAMKQPPSLERP